MKNMKKYIILNWFLLAVFGTFMAYSAASVQTIIDGVNPYGIFIENIILTIILLIIAIIFFFQKKRTLYRLMKKMSVPLFYISILLLVLVIFKGSLAGGSKSVILIGGFNFQPLEMYKVTIILYLASKFATVRYKRSLQEIIQICIPAVLGSLLVFFQPDAGGFVILVLLMTFMVLFNGQQIKKILIVMGAGFAFLIPVGMIALSGYQSDRITLWLNPFTEGTVSDGSQFINGYIAISNGGIIGSGYMNSIQKAGYLPEPHTDYIFAIIAEELGLAGVVLTLLLLGSLVFLIFKVGYYAHERFGMLYCYGLGSLILIQTFVNIGGITGIIPMTGVTLPFISVGINSFAFLSVAVLATIPIIREAKRYEYKVSARANSTK